MDLICYLHPGWKPDIRPAPATREWMEATSEQFAYRCLPMNIANAHGWEVLCPCDFRAYWRGGDLKEDVIIQLGKDANPHAVPTSIFGHAVLTFHVFGVFRTPPGWNLFVGGSPNGDIPRQGRSGITPLSGVIETDWSPYTFTMNWRFTRRNHWVHFRKGDPICFMFPVQRNALENFQPRYEELTGELSDQFKAWSKSRDAFRIEMEKNPPAAPSDKWQKLYYRGLDASGRPADISVKHKAKLRLAEFLPIGRKSKPQPSALNLTTDVETLSRVLRIVSAGIASGADRDVLASGLQELGLSIAEARSVISGALENAP